MKHEDEFEEVQKVPEPEEKPKRSKKDDSEKWDREAGVYKNWRPPNWASENSRRL